MPINFRFNIKTRLIISGVLFALGIFIILQISLFQTQDILSAQAALANKIRGWGWSENIGWISMNCYNDFDNDGDFENCCPGGNVEDCPYGLAEGDYGVGYNTTNGKLTGYAWSDGMGWICFGETCQTVCLGGSNNGVACTIDDNCPDGECGGKPPHSLPVSWACVGNPGWYCTNGGDACKYNSQCILWGQGLCRFSCSDDAEEDFVDSGVCVRSNHLKSHWKMNDLSEGTIADDSVNSNKGTLMPVDTPPIQAQGKFSNALQFDGEEDYIEVADDDSLSIDGNLTIEAWIKRGSIGNGLIGEQTIIGKWNESTGIKSYRLWFDIDNLLNFTVSGTTTAVAKQKGGICVGNNRKECDGGEHDGNDCTDYNAITNCGVGYPCREPDCVNDEGCVSDKEICKNVPIIDTSKWHHITGKYVAQTAIDNPKLNLFIDGSLVHAGTIGTIPTSLTNKTEKLYIGATPGKTAYFNGIIDNVSVWSCQNLFKITGRSRKEIWDDAKIELDGWARIINLGEEGWLKLRGLTKDGRVWGSSLDHYSTFYTFNGYMGNRWVDESMPTNGLVAHWKMNEPDWEGTSDEVVDSSGNENHGTAYNGANVTNEGIFNSAGDFDGVDDYIDVPDDDSLDINSAITIEAWIKPTSENTNLLDRHTVDWKDPLEWSSSSNISWDSTENALKVINYKNVHLDKGDIPIDISKGYYLEYDIKQVREISRSSYSGTHSYATLNGAWLPGHPGSYDYFTDSGKVFTNDVWYHRKNDAISGAVRTGETDTVSDRAKWHTGTKYATIMFLFNYSGSGQTSYLKNLEFYETETGINKKGAYDLSFSNTSCSGRINNQRINTSLTADVWNHVVMTYDKNASANQQKLYVNGILKQQGTLTETINTNTENLFIYLNGLIDNVAIYSRALLPIEILAAYNKRIPACAGWGDYEHDYDDPPAPLSFNSLSVANGATCNQLLVYWSPSDWAENYTYWRCNGDSESDCSSCSYTERNVLDGSCTLADCELTDDGLDPNTGYCYKIQAHNETGSTWGTDTPPIYPAPYWKSTTLCSPEELSGDADTCGQITLSWDKGTDVDGYNIYRSLVETGSSSCVSLTNSGCELTGHLAEALDYKAENGANNDLIAQWKMNEASWNGTTGEVIDSSTQTPLNNGTASCVGGDCIIAGIFDQAGDFDGVSDYVEVESATTLDLTENATVSAWVKIPSSWSGSDYPNIISKGANAGWDTDGWSLYAFSPVANDKIGIGMRNGVDRKSIDFTNTIKDEWTHIVGTWDGSIIKIYQNGLLKNSIAQTFSPPSTETSLTIGRDSGTQYFNGSIDNVSIYNVAKTVEQIKIDYEAGTNSNCVSGQCGLDYVCDDETEPHDKCGAANTCCYTDSRIIPYVNYYYRITATGETGETPSTGIDDPAQTICFPAPEEEEE